MNDSCILKIHNGLADPGEGIEIFRRNYFKRDLNGIPALQIINELEQSN